MQYAIPVFSNEDVADKFVGVTKLSHNTQYRLGRFTIIPLNVSHNVPNFAYVIRHEEFGILLYATDCIDFPHKINGVNHLLIEANYDENIVLDNLCKGADIRSHNEYHMEIGKTIETILRHKSESLNTVTICHLSTFQSDEKGFVKRILAETGIKPKVAKKGLVIDIDKEEF